MRSLANPRLLPLIPFFVALVAVASHIFAAEVVIAEGEQFQPRAAGELDWRVTHQNESYGSHTYGGMWMTHGGCLGAPAASVGSVAIQPVQVPAAGDYRVWSKYQAPPYFNYLHAIEVAQGGKVVFSHVYGKRGTDRLWSFSGESNELWWPWGVDHDAAEAPKQMAKLAAGPAEIRLITVENAKPAGDRRVDFIVLTTNPADDYQGFKPYAIGTPFALEALAATKLYLRFQNTTQAPAKLKLDRAGHFQPQYGGASGMFPAADVPAGQWSEWFNIGPFCRLVHDEGLWPTLAGAAEIPIQVARDPAGKDLVGDLKVANGEAFSIPLEITWQKAARVKASREHAREIVAASKTWRTANGGQKPQEILYFGAFGNGPAWVPELKDALGYNTELPEKFPGTRWEGLHSHLFGPDAIRAFAAGHKAKERVRFISFGDEISLGKINYQDPANQVKFRAWLKAKKVAVADLKLNPDEATLTDAGNPRLVWYSNLFNEEERFGVYRESTEAAEAALGKQILTGANYSPHHLALCYGPIFQWVDIFKHRGMSMFWGEDYIFSVPEVPQIISWMFAQMRCGVKYHNQPMHFYVMPHAPGQTPGNLRRNMLASVGFGARHIDSFWVAPEESFTENYVAWNYRDQFRVIHEAIYDSAEAEKLQAAGKVRPARVAVVTGKATDFNESRLLIDKSQDPLASQCKNAPAQLNQIICRKDQQMLYLALRQAQHAVELITEDDIVDRDELARFDVVYFAGEWIDSRAIGKLETFVRGGGVLYATAGCGHLNQYGEPEPAMLKLLGLKGSRVTKNAVVIRTLLELPLLPPIDTMTFDGTKIPCLGLRQQFEPDQAKVLATWTDGSAAATLHELGKGKVFAVGTLAGNTYMKPAVRVQPWPRGGTKQVYNPTEFEAGSTKLVRLGVDARPVEQPAVCGNPLVEAIVLDHPAGTLVTLLNWTNAPLKGLPVSVRLPFAPQTVRSVAGQKALDKQVAGGTVSFKIDLDDADYVLLLK